MKTVLDNKTECNKKITHIYIVYLYNNGNDVHIKIGKSDKPEARLKNFQTVCPNSFYMFLKKTKKEKEYGFINYLNDKKEIIKTGNETFAFNTGAIYLFLNYIEKYFRMSKEESILSRSLILKVFKLPMTLKKYLEVKSNEI